MGAKDIFYLELTKKKWVYKEYIINNIKNSMKDPVNLEHYSGEIVKYENKIETIDEIINLYLNS